MKQLFCLVHAQARHGAIETIRTAPDGYIVTIKEPTRTLEQNSMIHPVIANLARVLRRKTDKESLRQLRYLLLEQWTYETGRKPTFERSYDGMRWVCINKGTSDLEKSDCTEFIEWLLFQESQVTQSQMEPLHA